MRSLCCLAALALLASCGQDPAANNHGYGWAYNAIGTTGLRVQYRLTSAPNDFPSPNESVIWFESHYAHVSACMGMVADPPMVVLTEPGTILDANGTKLGGMYNYDPPLIVVQPAWRFDGLPPDPEWLLPSMNFRHEVCHHLLDQSGFPRELNNSHRSACFTTCAVL